MHAPPVLRCWRGVRCQAWGVMEADAGRIHAARECFIRGLAAAERNVPLLTAWARLEVNPA